MIVELEPPQLDNVTYECQPLLGIDLASFLLPDNIHAIRTKFYVFAHQGTTRQSFNRTSHCQKYELKGGHQGER